MNSEIMPLPPETPRAPKLFIQRVWDWLTAPSKALKEIGEQRSARLAIFFLLIIAIATIVGSFGRGLYRGMNQAFSVEMQLAIVIALLAYLISRTQWYRSAILLFSLSFNSLAYISIILQGNEADQGTLILLYVPLGLIIASFFLSPWSVLLLVGLNTAAYLSTQLLFRVSLPVSIAPQIAMIWVIGIVLLSLSYVRNTIENARLRDVRKINRELRTLSQNLEQRVEVRTQELMVASEQSARRADQLTAISELARSLTGFESLKNLLPAITDFVSQRLGFYHVGIFLSDEEDAYAVLRAANSEGGQIMLGRGHRLRIGEEGIVGYAIHTGQPRIALDVGADSAYFENPDLRDTRSEMALPLRMGSEIIGALDIQSTEKNAFSREDIAVYTTLADQVAIAIQNSRLLTQTQSTLREIEQAYTQQTRQAWSDFSRSQSVSGYYFDGIEPKPLTNGSESDTDFETGLIIPMRLRGQTIGKLKFKSADKARVWSDEEIALAEAALERAALALENARLLEEAQRRATKERIISEGSTRVSAALDVESVLKATAEELERALGSSEVVIQIESEE